MKLLTFLVCSGIVGISIILSAFIFSNSLSSSLRVPKNSIPDVMTIKQLSEYLQLSKGSIDNIIKKDDSEKAALSSYDTYRFIPYLKINHQKRFLKTEIDKWLEYQNDNR